TNTRAGSERHSSAEEEEEDIYGTRIPVSQLVSLALDSPAALANRSEQEMDTLSQLAATPQHMSRVFSEAASMPALMQKNRYSNIIPTRGSRVILPSRTGDIVESYINACVMQPLLPGCTQRYLAAQAPLPNTICDFWRMVWDQGSELIVMLT